jgi:hypothetical protein
VRQACNGAQSPGHAFSPHDGARPPHTTYSAGAGTLLGCRPLGSYQHANVPDVGGGIAGCSAVLHAAEAGTRVVLLEANEIGWGTSSRNTGHVPPPSTIPRRLSPTTAPPPSG